MALVPFWLDIHANGHTLEGYREQQITVYSIHSVSIVGYLQCPVGCLEHLEQRKYSINVCPLVRTSVYLNILWQSGRVGAFCPGIYLISKLPFLNIHFCNYILYIYICCLQGWCDRGTVHSYFCIYYMCNITRLFW